MLAHDSYKTNHLISLVATGDENAFRQLFRLYWDNVYAVAFTFTKSNVIAEEIVQDVFLKIWVNRRGLATVTNFDNYLFIIARNHIYNELRKKATSLPSATEVGETNSPEQQLLFKETVQIVAQAVQQLPKQQRTVYELSRNEGLDYASIAERMSLSRLTVKTHLSKALQSIRAYLYRHNGTFLLIMCLTTCATLLYRIL